MTLTSFLDVKAEPTKPDETKVDLMRDLNSEPSASPGPNNFILPANNPLHDVEYVELYNHRVAKRRCMCRTLAWLLAAFLLLDVAIVLYVGLRMRHAAAAAESDLAATSTFTCRLKFRGSAGDQQAVERTERITASSQRILMQPGWVSDGKPTVLHDFRRGFTLLRTPAARLCFVKQHIKQWVMVTRTFIEWAKEEHDVRPEHTYFIRLVAKQPAISLKQLMSYGNLAFDMCKSYTTYLIVPVVVDMDSNCPMYKCAPCPNGVYLRDSKGCRTCKCSSRDAVEQDADDESDDRRRKRATRRTVLEVDEGVLPRADGRGAVHTIDVIEL